MGTANQSVCPKCGHPNHQSRMHQDICTFYVPAVGAECGCRYPQGNSIALNSWVDEAVRRAMESPCRSKRGVAISSKDGRLISSGFNHQPFPFQCDNSERCKRNCGKTAIHAEQSAILAAHESVTGAWMLHVKADQGKPCASMAPSCLECSKLILASGIAWMHLLHDPVAQMLPGAVVEGEVEGFLSDGKLGMLQIRRYSAVHFHYLTAEYYHRIELVLPNRWTPDSDVVEHSEIRREA